MANGIVAGIVGLTIGVIMMANVLMPTLKGVNTTEWTASETAMWSVAGLGAVIGIVYGILSTFNIV
jgi:hypothetical protein